MLPPKTETSRDGKRRPGTSVLIVTGISGAGRTTTLNALEDLGYEAMNNFPISMIESLIELPNPEERPIAISVETRTRGFSARALTDALDLLKRRWSAGCFLVFLDAEDEALAARFNQTRRRHPLAPSEDAATGIKRERSVLAGIIARADIVIDTTHLTPHDLKKDIEARFALTAAKGLMVSVHSFSYKHGTPSDADMVLDCRFLRNPYWDVTLRDLDGRDPRIQAFVEADPRFDTFFEKLGQMVLMLLPAYLDEGKAYFSIALGCTGGRHRSVVVAERLAKQVAGAGWSASVRHRELRV